MAFDKHSFRLAVRRFALETTRFYIVLEVIHHHDMQETVVTGEHFSLLYDEFENLNDLIKSLIQQFNSS